ncbi:ATP-binding protein [uncultured Azohydromonas sp.]|jgi:Signal transduction histidine kinase regulating C4-dicarboxylate transport system|uniref:ATP-binding protein n=1 Tax=uncultured Azohydromonas sp. TaxID=487342 RepID=UPI002630F47D|nr:ATP-binding protein [uncultured Azohydromonas sp.]
MNTDPSTGATPASSHKLLQRQLRRAFGSIEATPAGLENLLAAISQAYEDADTDRAMIERSLNLMSRELNDRNDRLRAELAERQRQADEQQALIRRLEKTQSQLVQAEKMASIGQLAAGVAHEINNPIGYVGSNLTSLQTYVQSLLAIVAAFEARLSALPPSDAAALRMLMEEHDYAYLREDVQELLRESSTGVQRVRQIVQDLKDFSHAGEQEWVWADLHKGLDSTLNIVHNEIKYVADVERRYGEIPQVHCLASQLNQVFMNLLINAAHAVTGRESRGRIVVTTGCLSPDEVFVEIADNGCSIAPEHLRRIFDPFFTTKPVGKGTGLGLSVSYGIVSRHGGRIEVDSRLGEGTRFRVCLPVRHEAREAERTTG